VDIREMLRTKWWMVVVGAVVMTAAVVWWSSRSRYPISEIGADSPEAVATLAAVRRLAELAEPGADLLASDITVRARDELAAAVRPVREVVSVKSAQWAGEYLRVVVSTVGDDGRPRDVGVYAVSQGGAIRLRGAFGAAGVGGGSDSPIGAAPDIAGKADAFSGNAVPASGRSPSDGVGNPGNSGSRPGNSASPGGNRPEGRR